MERGESRAGSRNSYFSAPLLLPPLPPTSFLFIRRFKNIYIYIIYLFWLCRVLVEACKIFPVACFSCGMQTLSCSMQDLVPRPGIEPGPPALGAQSLTHWTTWEVPLPNFLFIYLFIYLFMAVLGLRFCARAFSSCSERGPLFIAVRGPLTVAASLVAEHRLQTRSLSSCGSRA